MCANLVVTVGKRLGQKSASASQPRQCGQPLRSRGRFFLLKLPAMCMALFFSRLHHLLLSFPLLLICLPLLLLFHLLLSLPVSPLLYSLQVRFVGLKIQILWLLQLKNDLIKQIFSILNNELVPLETFHCIPHNECLDPSQSWSSFPETPPLLLTH